MTNEKGNAGPQRIWLPSDLPWRGDNEAQALIAQVRNFEQSNKQRTCYVRADLARAAAVTEGAQRKRLFLRPDASDAEKAEYDRLLDKFRDETDQELVAEIMELRTRDQAQREALAECAGALKPFADIAEEYDDMEFRLKMRDGEDAEYGDRHLVRTKLGDIRIARAALAKAEACLGEAGK